MADFFSRIFAIPSDVSSSPESAVGAGAVGGGRRRKGHSRSLTPLSLTDGNGTSLASQSFGEGTLSYGVESDGRSESQVSSASASLEDRPRREKRGGRHAPSRRDSGDSGRGRQRRNDSSAHRSASVPRSPTKKTHRSSSMAPASSPRHGSSRNMQLQLNSPTKKGEPRRRSASAHPRVTKKQDSGSSGNLRSSGGTGRSAEKAAKKEKRERKERKDGWRSKLAGGVKKHLSPGVGGTPPQKSNKSKGGKKKHHQHATTSPSKRNARQRLPSNGDKSFPPPPINVGDSIVISQQFLEENAEMSVLTMPKELASMDEDEAIVTDFDKEIQEVGMRTVMENHRVREYLGRRQNSARDEHSDGVPASSSTDINQRGPIYKKIGAYASRVIEEGNVYRSYSHDQQLDPSVDGYSPKAAGIPPPPPPPPPPMPLQRHGRNDGAQSSQQLKVSIPQYNITANDGNSSLNDPPGTLVTSPTMQLQSPEATGKKEDPPGDPYAPFDESFGEDGGGIVGRHGAIGNAAALQAAGPQTTGQGNARPNKAVTFSLPPPSSASHPPAPPFMGPPLDYYYSMERSPNGYPMPAWSSSPILPPIIELWSSVESADNLSDGRWNAKRENELLGENVPLHVHEKFIDVCEKEKSSRDTNKATRIPEPDGSVVHHRKMSPGKQISSAWDEDTPHDEHFDDILNCGEDFANMAVNEQGSQTQQRGGISSSDTDTNDKDANFRHRSTWNIAYKPPKVSAMDDPFLHDQSRNGDWQRMVRIRNNAAVTIQKSVRGLLERERIRLLLDSVLIIQPCVRRYLSRKRFLYHIRLKRSYHPKRWERINMEVA